MNDMQRFWHRIHRALPSLLTFLSLLFVTTGFIALIVMSNQVQESQNTRTQASVENGPVLFEPILKTTVIPAKMPHSLQYTLNTNGEKIDGIQLYFSISSPVISSEDLLITVLPDSGLVAHYIAVSAIDDGYQVAVQAVPADNAPYFQSTTPVPMLNIAMKPLGVGDIDFVFDIYDSFTMKYQHQNVDVLRHIPVLKLSAVHTSTPTPTPAPTATPTPTPPGATPTPTPNPTPTPPGPTPTPVVTVVSCNQVCSSNNQCPADHRCYDTGSAKVCRLAVNPTNASCQSSSSQGTTSLLACNYACTNSRECQAGLACVSNRCRNPENPSSATCAAPSAAQVAALAASCNSSCSSHAQCATNFLCVGSQCRLATNPSSTSCSSTSHYDITGQLYGSQAKTGPSKQNDRLPAKPPADEKGLPTLQDLIDKAATQSATATPSAPPTVAVTDTPPPQTQQWSGPLSFLNTFNLPREAAELPVWLIGIGAVLGILALLFLVQPLTGSRAKHTVYKPPAKSGQTPPSMTQNQTYGVHPTAAPPHKPEQF